MHALVPQKKLGRKTSKLKLQKLIKSKMLGFKFVSHVTEQAELHKKKEESMNLAPCSCSCTYFSLPAPDMQNVSKMPMLWKLG